MPVHDPHPRGAQGAARAKQVARWLEEYQRSETPQTPEDREGYMRQVFAGLIHDLLDAIEEFGYEAVYFGVGCEVFPDAVDPFKGNDY